MAYFYLQIRSVSRGNGSCATGAAAYRAGERIRDERTGRSFNYARRQDVLHKEIVLPSRFAGEEMGWARDRAKLWNEAERAESLKNARVAREYVIALSNDLPAEQRLRLTLRFARELSDRHQNALDVAIHAPRPGGDPRNFHAHLLATTREITPGGLGAKTSMEYNTAKRLRLGLGGNIQELKTIRERWAILMNQAFREAKLELHVDHRTLKEQGIDRPRLFHLPRIAWLIERSGRHSTVAAAVRERYKSYDIKEAQRQSVDAWLKYRQKEFERPSEVEREEIKEPYRGQDRDLGM